MRKSTDDLFEELEKKCEITDYINNNSSSFVFHSIHELWEQACEKSGLSKTNIINKADFNYCYFYDVINGRKIPSKDKIIRLALTMHMSLDDCQQILRLSDKPLLYPRVKRDSIIIYSLNNNLSFYECNELLGKFDEEVLK